MLKKSLGHPLTALDLLVVPGGHNVPAWQHVVFMQPPQVVGQHKVNLPFPKPLAAVAGWRKEAMDVLLWVIGQLVLWHGHFSISPSRPVVVI